MKYFRAFVLEEHITQLTPQVYERFKNYLFRVTCPNCGAEIEGEGLVRCACGRDVVARRRSPRTVDLRLTAIGLMISFLEAQEIIAPGSIRRPKLIRARSARAPEFWTDADVDRILRAAEGRYIHDMILFGLYTGLRLTELVHLRWADVNREGGFLTVQGYDIEYRGRRFTFEPKDHDLRRVKLNAHARQLLESIRSDREWSPWVFPSGNGVPRNGHIFRRDLRQVCDRAGVHKGASHSIRRTFAVHLLMKGTDLESIRQLLGHSDISTTQKYLNVTPEHLDQAVDRLDFTPPAKVVPFKKR